VPISALCPNYDNPKVKARVISKSDIRTYKNQKGDGKLFNIEI
jgi:ssDNA-binding replication factor A large subunit